MKYFKIGELSKLTKISIDTIRYYEKMNLLNPTTRSDSGYRLYSKEDLQKIQFILRAKAVGFSLKEILELLSLNSNKENQTCEDVKQFAESSQCASGRGQGEEPVRYCARNFFAI